MSCMQFGSKRTIQSQQRNKRVQILLIDLINELRICCFIYDVIMVLFAIHISSLRISYIRNYMPFYIVTVNSSYISHQFLIYLNFNVQTVFGWKVIQSTR